MAINNGPIAGVYETNPLPSADYHDAFHNAPTLDWSDKRLAKVTRLRLLSDPGFPFWDVSYCHGVMRDGTPVRVALPFSQLPKRTCKASIIEAAKRDGVYAAGLGVFDALSTLV